MGGSGAFRGQTHGTRGCKIGGVDEEDEGPDSPDRADGAWSRGTTLERPPTALMVRAHEGPYATLTTSAAVEQ